MPVGALPFFTTDVVLLHFLQTTLIVAIMPPCTQIRKGITKRQNKLSTVLIYDQAEPSPPRLQVNIIINWKNIAFEWWVVKDSNLRPIG